MGKITKKMGKLLRMLKKNGGSTIEESAPLAYACSSRYFVSSEWCNLEVFTPEKLYLMTNGFSDENLLGHFKFGDLFRGENLTPTVDDEKFVTIKIWRFDNRDSAMRDEFICLLKREISFLTHPEVSHLCLPKIIGCCWDHDNLAAIYEINPLGTLEKLVEQDCFEWADRVHVALKLASLLTYLHGFEPCLLVRDLCAAHIVLDQEKKPILYDLGMLVGGGMLEGKLIHHDRLMFDDNTYPLVASTNIGVWSKSSDVFSYGVLLLELLRARDFEKSYEGIRKFDGKTWYGYKNRHLFTCSFSSAASIVGAKFIGQHHHNSYDTFRFAKLAVKCLDTVSNSRPSMDEVVESLKSLFLLSINEMRLIPFKGGSLGELSFEDLSFITNGFSTENLLGETQFGTLYKGKILEGWKGREAQEVTVKVWDESRLSRVSHKDHVHKLKDELAFLRHPRSLNHPCLPKVFGFCYKDKKLGVVYKLKTVGTLKDFLSKDNFKWADRIDIINQFTSLLHFLHTYDPPYIVGNLSAGHVLLDEDLHMVLVDFGMMTGGILGDKKVEKHLPCLGSTGYIDAPSMFVGWWSRKMDVYAFGVLLIELMCKKHVFEGEVGCFSLILSVRCRIRKYENEENLASFFVDEVLKTHVGYNDGDAHAILMMALHCITPTLPERLSINEILPVVERLEFFCPSQLV